MLNVLVVDPDVLIRRMVFNSLSSEEFHVIDAERPDQAVKAAHDESPRLILLDSQLSKDSPTLVLDLRREAPEARIALLCPHGEEAGDVDRHLVDEMLEKPFSPLGLVRTTHRLLGNEAEIDPRPLHDVERQQLLLYARDLARMRRDDERKTQQLKVTHHRLQEFEKMKDMFLALVSHELRTPLTIIKGNVHLLRRLLRNAEAGTKEEKVAGIVESLAAGSQRLEGLVTDLMSYSSVRCGVAPFELRPLDLRSLLVSVLQEFEKLAVSKSVHFEFEPPGEDVTLMGDSGRLREAFSHVVKNAILYNVPQGSVVVRCHHGGPDQIVVSVIDSGPGVSLAERDKVFNPFYQASDVLTRRVEGIGLGLAITRHIVESHGGQIRLAGELGKGTEVRVSLPVAQPEVTQGEFAPPSPEEFERQHAQDGDQEGALSDYSKELYAAYDRERVRRRHLEDQYRDMENTYLETLAALMRQIDVRNTHQESHVDKVMLYAAEIARRVEPSLPRNKDFLLSLLLHDIGKIGVAESLLQKVGRLTDEEQRQIRESATHGVEFLQSIDYLQPALVGVRHSHERWDGKGYPDGLQGREIPLWSRIIAVADAFDAMISDRPYRKAMNPEEARAEIEKNAGTQFDPEIVLAFQQAYDALVELPQEAVAE